MDNTKQDDIIISSRNGNNEDVQFHKHCQKTVLPAHGINEQIGATWYIIKNLLDNNELPNLKEGWIERLEESNENITEDIAAILKIINDNCHYQDCNLLPTHDIENCSPIIPNVNIYNIGASNDFSPIVDLEAYKNNNLDIVRFEYHITNLTTDKEIQVLVPTIVINGNESPSDWTITCFTDDNKIAPDITSIIVFRADMKSKLLEYGLAYKRGTQKFTVRFFNAEKEVISTQLIGYGCPATEPPHPTKEGHTFKCWDHDFTYVTSDLNISPIFESDTGTITYDPGYSEE